MSLAKLERLTNDVKNYNDFLTNGQFMREVLKATENKILSWNADTQLYEQGVNALGVSIDSYKPYTDLTIEIKKEKGQPYDRVTLRDTGDFEWSFYLQIDDDRFFIYSKDEKTEKLVKKYGKNIFGLTPEHTTELIWSYIYPYLLKRTKELTQWILSAYH